MAFLNIFKSKAERDRELKSKLRQAHNKIEQHVRKLFVQEQKYLGLAKKAHDLRDKTQFGEYATKYYSTQRTSNRWKKYQLKLSAMEIQRDELRATEEFLSGISSLTQDILRGVKPEEIQRVAQDIQLAEERCTQLEEAMETEMRDVLQPLQSNSFDDSLLQGIVDETSSSLHGLGADPFNASGKSRTSNDLNSFSLSFEEALRVYQVME
ncbi:MAG: hypothetical protein RLY14_1802 [Planctomycetota bacterium]|jgi:hypothetical protein